MKRPLVWLAFAVLVAAVSMLRQAFLFGRLLTLGEVLLGFILLFGIWLALTVWEKVFGKITKAGRD